MCGDYMYIFLAINAIKLQPGNGPKQQRGLLRCSAAGIDTALA
jgi:hypothetical protein